MEDIDEASQSYSALDADPYELLAEYAPAVAPEESEWVNATNTK